MHVTYLFDPLCGWCYGAVPALEHIAGQKGFIVTLSPTGLFAGEGSRPMDRNFADYAWQNDQRIARLTGQVFSDAYRSNVLDAAGGLFDSAPATLGIVAVGLTQPDGELSALKALQHTRYVDGIDTASRETVASVLKKAGFHEAALRVRSPDEELLSAYRTRIAAARADMARFGAQGVPTLIVGEGQDRRMVRCNALYGRFDLLTAELKAA
ncbi:DsbA family protein (plasmid) [Agrobacterium leguminum]|uniref:DsbA family protein n=1 Tax=Agrobacterium leguminum TaxID=2792015 RepID=UPI00272CD43C|nr:DsbA family protein [Agrobacterium leguminum]WLE00605.1 DsbA family protein [Agrobacterium leguminum]